MENIIIVKTFFDEQWDVEVYQESGQYKGLLKRMKSLFEYGLTEEELEDYIKDLKEKYNVVK